MLPSVKNELINSITYNSLQEEKINFAEYLIKENLNSFITNPNVDNLLDVSYGEEYQKNLAKSLLENQIKEGFKDVKINIINSNILNNANAGYAESFNTIFVGDNFIKSNSVEVIAQVLTEEFGHFLDSKINPQDSKGDEGEIFAKLVFNQSLNSDELSILKQENDRAYIDINGELVSIEQSVFELHNNGEIIAVNNDTSLIFQCTKREALYDNELGLIIFDNPEGKIDGIAPQEEGYIEKILNSSDNQVIFTKG